MLMDAWCLGVMSFSSTDFEFGYEADSTTLMFLNRVV